MKEIVEIVKLVWYTFLRIGGFSVWLKIESKSRLSAVSAEMKITFLRRTRRTILIVYRSISIALTATRRLYTRRRDKELA
jgi:K+ transporter